MECNRGGLGKVEMLLGATRDWRLWRAVIVYFLKGQTKRREVLTREMNVISTSFVTGFYLLILYPLFHNPFSHALSIKCTTLNIYAI